MLTDKDETGEAMDETKAAPEACENTDRELWRERAGDYYSPSIHVTRGGGIGINVGGTVIVMPLGAWHDLASRSAPAHSQPTPEIVSLKAALAVERAAREKAEAALRGAVAEFNLRADTNEGKAKKATPDASGIFSGASLAYEFAADYLKTLCARAALASPSESASQPTPEARVEWEALRCPHDPGADDFHTCATCMREWLARRAAPTGQQQEAGAAPPAAPKHEEWCALYGDPEKGESCDCAAAPPSAPQEGLFKEGWEAGREAAALLFVEDAERFRAEADRALAMDLTVLAKMHMGDAAECLREAGRIRARPLPESALPTQPAAPEKEQDDESGDEPIRSAARRGDEGWPAATGAAERDAGPAALDGSDSGRARRGEGLHVQGRLHQRDDAGAGARRDPDPRRAEVATSGVTLKDAKEGVAPVHIEVECLECNASFAVDRDGDGAPAPVETREPPTKEK